MDTPAKKLANLANLKRLLIFAPSMAIYLTTEFCRDFIKLLSPANSGKLFLSVNAYLIFVILDALFVITSLVIFGFSLKAKKSFGTTSGIIFTFR